MKIKPLFYICKHCGNLVSMVEDKGVSVVCCGEPMTRLEPNTVDAAAEKHLPAVTRDGETIHVEVGSVLHPMTEEHYIQWVYVASDTLGQRKCFAPGDRSVHDFCDSEGAVAVYAYCNLHGLWKVDA